MTWAVPLAALFIAGASFVVSSILATRSLSRSASSDWVHQLEVRVAECERDRTEMRSEIAKLRDREIFLMQRLMRIEGQA